MECTRDLPRGLPKNNSLNCMACAALVVLGCGAPQVTPDVHGVNVEPGQCGRGLVVLETDYHSTNVSLMGFGGAILTPSLVHSN
jgi:hypothetical protein